MRVLCVTSSFPRHAEDHAGRFVYELCAGLAAAGDDVHALAPDGHGPVAEDRWLPPRLRLTRVRYAWPRAAQRLFYGSGAPEHLSRSPAASLLAPLATSALGAAVARHAPAADVVFAHWLVPAGLAAVVGAARARVPVVAVAHSGDVHLLSRLPGGAALARFLARHGSVCAVAGDVSARLRSLGVAAPVVPLGASLLAPEESAAQVRARLGVRAARLVVGLGRLEPVKGYELLVDALVGLPAALVLAGDGSLREPLRRRAAERGVELHLCGFVGAEQKSSLLHAADVVAFPSRRLPGGRTEGLPVALLEARLAGAPLVACDVGALREGLRATDRLVPADDVAALRSALVAALAAEPRSSPEIVKSDNCYFSSEAALARYRAILAEAVAARATGGSAVFGADAALRSVAATLAARRPSFSPFASEAPRP